MPFFSITTPLSVLVLLMDALASGKGQCCCDSTFSGKKHGIRSSAPLILAQWVIKGTVERNDYGASVCLQSPGTQCWLLAKRWFWELVRVQNQLNMTEGKLSDQSFPRHLPQDWHFLDGGSVEGKGVPSRTICLHPGGFSNCLETYCGHGESHLHRRSAGKPWGLPTPRSTQPQKGST